MGEGMEGGGSRKNNIKRFNYLFACGRGPLSGSGRNAEDTE